MSNPAEGGVESMSPMSRAMQCGRPKGPLRRLSLMNEPTLGIPRWSLGSPSAGHTDHRRTGHAGPSCSVAPLTAFHTRYPEGRLASTMGSES